MYKCAVCGSKSITYFNYLRIENSGFELYKCNRCNFTFQKDFSNKILNYDEDYYLREKEIDKKFLQAKSNYKYDFIKPFLKNKKSILEIGCSTGEFLEVCKIQNYIVEGIEISAKAVEICRQKNLPVIVGDSYTLSKLSEKYDVVVGFDVIEHLTDIGDFVNNVYNILNKDGIIIVETPNFNSLLRILNPKKWIGYNQYHLTYFNPFNLNMLFAKSRFKNIYMNTSSLDIYTFNFWKRTVIFDWIKEFISAFLPKITESKKVKFPTYNRYNNYKKWYYGDEIIGVFKKLD